MALALRASNAAAVFSPAVIDFWLAQINPRWSSTRCLATVDSRRRESRETVTLVLKPNRRFRGFLPGQHLNLTAVIDGARVTRSYSFSDAHRRDGRVSITVRHVPGGKLSTHLCRHSGVGEVVELGVAFGEMNWSSATGQDWTLLAAGSGITPMMSLIRSLEPDLGPRRVQLLYWARTADDLCFADELLERSRRDPRLRCHFLLTGEGAGVDQPRGRISPELLQTLRPDWHSQHVYACGPYGFVETARSMLVGRTSQFRSEAFTPLPAPAGDDREVNVALLRSGRSLRVRCDLPLLDALEAHGLRPPHGCRMGICNSCACAKTRGVVRDLRSGAADAEPSQALRLCSSLAQSDLSLDL